MFTVLVIWLTVCPWILIYGSPLEYFDGNGSDIIAYTSQRIALGLVLIFFSSLILGYRIVWLSILGMLFAFHRMIRLAHEEYDRNETAKLMKQQSGMGSKSW